MKMMIKQISYFFLLYNKKNPSIESKTCQIQKKKLAKVAKLEGVYDN